MTSEPHGPLGAPPEGGTGPEDILGVGLLVAILIVMATGVFYRYVLNDSLAWPEEAARYGLAYITFIGVMTGIRRRSHIRVDILERMLPPLPRAVLERAIDVACLLFFVYMAIKAYELCTVLHRSRSAAMGVPMSWAYGALVLGFVGGALRMGWMLGRDLLAALRGGR